jgi:hypothetical protein
MSATTRMQPAAWLLPATVSIIVQSGSAIMAESRSAARATSRALKDMRRIASTNGVASKEVMSMCSTGDFSRSRFFMAVLLSGLPSVWLASGEALQRGARSLP